MFVRFVCFYFVFDAEDINFLKLAERGFLKSF